MQRNTLIIISTVVLLLFLPIGFSYSGGLGTAASPYQIANCLDLNQTRLNMTSFFKLTSDIDCSATYNWGNGVGFVPIGNSSALSNVTNAFKGNFNGSGYAIKSLYINTSNIFAGLFGVTSTATIYNFTLYAFNITGVNFIGALSAYSDTDTISYVRLVGNVSAANNNCGSNGVVTMGSVFGAFGYNAGSVAHNISSGTDIYMINCNTVNQNIGGFSAYNNGNNISDSYYVGKMTFAGSSSLMKIGGFEAQGLATGFNNVYSVITNVVSGSAAGGLRSTAGADVFTNSYWNNETSLLNTSTSGGVGYNNSAMKLNATFVGFNFSQVWNINQTNDYPYLRSLNYTTYSVQPIMYFSTPTPTNGSNVTTTLQVNVTATGIGNYINYSTVNLYYVNGTLYSSTNKSSTDVCYQESANVSTSCGGLSTGSYNASSDALTYDGNYSTGVYRGSVVVNYTKPIGALNSSLWQYSLYQSTPAVTNISIPSACWSASSTWLSLRIQYVGGGTFNKYTDVDCYNSTGWQQISHNDAGETGFTLYEEGMFWNITPSVGATTSMLFTLTTPTQATMLMNATVYTNDNNFTISPTRTYNVDTITAPTWSSFALTPTTAYANSTLVCSYNVSYSTNMSVNLSWYNGSTLLQSTAFNGTSNSSTLLSTVYKGNNISCNVTAYGGIYTITNGSNLTISNSPHIINSVVTNWTTLTIFNNFTIKVNVSDVDNDINSVNVSITYSNGTITNYTTSLIAGLYTTTSMIAKNLNYSISVYTDDSTNSTAALILNITDAFSSNPNPYSATVAAGQNFTFNLTTFGDSSENLTFNYSFTFANSSYFNSSATTPSDNHTFNGTHLIVIATNLSIPGVTYLANLTVTRLIDGRQMVIPLTLSISTTYGQPYIYNLTQLRILMTSISSVSQVITINNTGNYTLSSCNPTLTNDFNGWSFYSWNDSSFSVPVNSSIDITLSISSPPVSTFNGYVQVTCVATSSGAQNSLLVANQPSVQLIVSQGSVPPAGGGGGSTTVVGGNISFSISPLILNAYVSPGSSKNYEIQITDVSNSLFDVDLNIIQNESWLSFKDGLTKGKVHLTPAVGISSQSQYVGYTISVPSGVVLGDYSAQIVVSSASSSYTQNIIIHVQPSLVDGLFNSLKKSVYSSQETCKVYSTIDVSMCVQKNSAFNVYLWEVVVAFFTTILIVIFIINKR